MLRFSHIAILGLWALSGCGRAEEVERPATTAAQTMSNEVADADRNGSQVHYSDIWTEMKENPGSPELENYVNVAESIDQKIGNAGAVLKCGIRNITWYRDVTTRLEEYRAGPAIAPLFAKLTDSERSLAQRFDRAVVEGQMEFSGGDFRKKDCEALARAPFVYSDAAFAP